MKSLFLALCLISSTAFGANICKFKETWEFHEALEKKGTKAFKVSKDHKRFSAEEKKLIHRAVTSQGYLSDLTVAQAVEEFGDWYRGKQGSNAGTVEYYRINGEVWANVHYFPGDNEVGSYFIQRNGQWVLKATVGDSFIDCVKGVK